MNRKKQARVWLLISSWIIWTVAVEATNKGKETFAEEALLSPLPDGLVLVHLHFTQQAAYRRHYTLFPKAVGQLAAAIPFQSLELSLTQGRWHYQRWGAPMLQARPAGAELRADFSPQIPADALPGLWGNLSHALGGLFCASLNFVARPEATAPLTISMQPAPQQQHQHQQQHEQQQEQEQGPDWVPGPASQHVLYAALPQEASCTENLTPWLKLLPCRDAAGLGRLLVQRGVVFGADYHSMQVTIKVQRDDLQRPITTTLTQSLTMVLRSPQQGSAGGPRKPPKPGTLSDVSLQALLGSTAPAACPVASLSRLYLQLPQQLLMQEQEQEQDWSALLEPPGYSGAGPVVSSEQQGGDSHHVGVENRPETWSTPWFDLSPAPDAAAILLRPGCSSSRAAEAADSDASLSGASECRSAVLYAYDLHVGQRQQDDANSAAPFSLTWQQEALDGAGLLTASPAAAAGTLPNFSVSRYITGTGNLHGGMVLHLTAAQPTVGISNTNISVCIFQVVPWYVRLWLHTLELRVDGQAIPLEDVLLLSYITPAQDRVRPLVLDLCMSLPQSVQSITLTAQFTKAFLRMLEHPPDAHRGFDVPAAIITVGDAPQGDQTCSISSSNASGCTPVNGSGVSSGTHATGGSYSAVGVHSGRVGRRWHVVVADVAPNAAELQSMSPLMSQMMHQGPPTVYSPGLVVPLAVPDFSMPYNVICLTSTVLAIFMGGVFNALLWRPGKDEREAADPKAALRKKRKKLIRLVVLVVAFVSVAVYFDADLQAELLQQARKYGLYAPGDAEL